MRTCETCKANKVCDHNKYGFENCGNYIPKEIPFDITLKMVAYACDDVFGANAKEEMRQRVLDCAVEIYIAQKKSDT